MLPDLIANASLLTAAVFYIGIYSKNKAVHDDSPMGRRVVYGLIFGIAGLLMTLFPSSPIRIDLSPAMVMLPAVFAGAVPALASAALQGALRTVLSSAGAGETLAIFGTGIACGLLAPLAARPLNRWLLMTVGSLPAAAVIFGMANPDAWRQTLPYHLLIHLLFCVLGYALLSYVWRVNTAKKRLEQDAGTDPLTGLANYRQLRTDLERIVERTERRMGLLLTDCEDVRLLNARHGYRSVNDKFVLTGRQLRLLFPEAEVIARFEGDKFCVVTSAERSDEWQERLRCIFERELPEATGLTFKYVSVVYPDECANAEAWIGKAEEKLTKLKEEYWIRREESTLWTEKMKVVGEMAAGMAHEIRNPLTAVKGFLQIAHETKQFDRWYPTVMHEINRMNELTVEFLSFSKPVKPNAAEEALEACAERAFHLMESEAIRAGHVMEMPLCEDSVMVRMDRDKMLQVLLNIMKNGLEAMEESGRLTIRVYRQPGRETAEGKAGSWGVVEITDTGPGIPPSSLEKIFDPFYSTKEKGTGLGLAICMNIVQNHGGDIQVSSRSDQGTTFFVRLPAIE